MRKVGFTGGISTYELGSQSNMCAFLNCVMRHASHHKAIDTEALIHEFYERYKV